MMIGGGPLWNAQQDLVGVVVWFLRKCRDHAGWFQVPEPTSLAAVTVVTELTEHNSVDFR
jgi:hypothetical protein